MSKNQDCTLLEQKSQAFSTSLCPWFVVSFAIRKLLGVELFESVQNRRIPNSVFLVCPARLIFTLWIFDFPVYVVRSKQAGIRNFDVTRIPKKSIQPIGNFYLDHTFFVG